MSQFEITEITHQNGNFVVTIVNDEQQAAWSVLHDGDHIIRVDEVDYEEATYIRTLVYTDYPDFEYELVDALDEEQRKEADAGMDTGYDSHNDLQRSF